MIRDQLLFDAFFFRVIAPLPLFDRAAMNTELMLTRRIDDNATAWLRSDRADYLRHCAEYARACQRVGPPAHIGGC